MAKNRQSLKSGNIVLTPLSPVDYDDFIESCPEKELLELFLSNRDKAASEYTNQNRDYLFYTLWKIDSLDSEKHASPTGYLFFHAPAEMGTTELTICIYRDYKYHGFGTAAIKTITEWAFMQRNVYEIQVFFDRENDGAIGAFTKSGYVFREARRDHTEKYSITKGPSGWGGAYFIIGIWAGCVIGILLNSLWVGLAMGVLLGAGIGVALEQKEIKHREEITQKTSEKRSIFSKKK